MNSPEFLDKPLTRPFQGEPSAEQLRETKKSIEKAEMELKLRAEKAKTSTENIEKQEKEAKDWRSGMGVNPNGDVEKRDLFSEKFGDFVQDRNEAIETGMLKVDEVLSPGIPIFDNTDRGFSPELISFYILKAIDQWHDKWSREFVVAEFEGLKDILQVDIDINNTKKKQALDWARFTLVVRLKSNWFDRFFNKYKFFKNILTSEGYFVFNLTDKEEIILES